MKRDRPVAVGSPSWQAVLVVCKDCQKRGSGPKRLKAKDVVHAARTALKAERPRPRVVVSGCLGLCPKRAIAVARVGAVGGARTIAAEAAEDVAVLATPPGSAAVASSAAPSGRSPVPVQVDGRSSAG